MEYIGDYLESAASLNHRSNFYSGLELFGYFGATVTATLIAPMVIFGKSFMLFRKITGSSIDNLLNIYHEAWGILRARRFCPTGWARCMESSDFLADYLI